MRRGNDQSRQHDDLGPARPSPCKAGARPKELVHGLHLPGRVRKTALRWAGLAVTVSARPVPVQPGQNKAATCPAKAIEGRLRPG